MTSWVDGRLVGAGALPQRTGIAPFETMGANNGAIALWDRHLARLSAAAARLHLPFAPDAKLRAAAGEVLRGSGHGNGVLRLSLVPAHDGVHTVMTSRGRSPVKTVKLLPAIVARPANAPPADLKAEPRAYYDAVLQQAQDGGADDGIVIDSDGALLETALGNLWLLRDGTWVTPALDGRVLPGIARALLLAAARAGAVRVTERACTLEDLHAARALAHSNAVYGPRAACLAGEKPAVAIVDKELGAMWRRATTNASTG